MNNKKVSLLIALLGGLVMTLAAVWLFTKQPLSVAEAGTGIRMADTVSSVAPQQESIVDHNNRLPTQPGASVDEYWLVPDVIPDGTPPEVQISDAFSSLFPLLARYEQMGQLQGFAPIPELGVIRLESPSDALLTELAARFDKHSILPITDQASYAAIEQAQTARMIALQESSVPDMEVITVLEAPQNTTGVGGLSSCTIYENENLVEGTVITSSLPMTLTLKTGSVIKSQITTVANSSGYFRAYFASTILGDDVVEVKLPSKNPIVINVPLLEVEADKALDIVSGIAPNAASVYLAVWSSVWNTYFTQNLIPNPDGSFTATFPGQNADLFMGDSVKMTAYLPSSGFGIVRQNYYTPGLNIDPENNYVNGYASPGATVNLALKDSSGILKATAVVAASSSGSFYTSFILDNPCGSEGVNIEVGDQVEMQYGSQPTVIVEVVSVTVDSVNPTLDTVVGTAPANSKVEIYAYDSYITSRAYKVVTADPGGQYTAGFTGLLDLALGSYASATYHNAQDNEVLGGSLYAGPYVKAYVNSYQIHVIGSPNSMVTATLRNALGAIKSTVQGMTSRDGNLYLYFYDTADNSVNPIPGDQLEVDFGGGVTRTLDVGEVKFTVTGRDDAQVSGVGPPNTLLRVIYSVFNRSGDVLTDANGAFSYDLNWVWGGYAVEVLYRNPDGNDISTYGYVPQFTIYPDNNYLYGYGPANQAVVATLQDSTGTPKETVSGVTNYYGYYYLYFNSADIVFGDQVVVDVGPQHYIQEVVTLTVNGDVDTNFVYGIAPAGGWLNINGYRSFGPYYASYGKSFNADYAGNYATNFGGAADIRGGDDISARYWQGGNKDRVYVEGYVPYVYISHQSDFVYGYTTPNAVGTVTIQDSGGTIKTTGIVTASETSGYFYFSPDGVDIVPGDLVDVQVGALAQTDTVVPLEGALDLGADTVSGLGPPNQEIGINVIYWYSPYYTYLDQFVDTNASGVFNADFSCMADLKMGDYLALYYMDDSDAHFTAYFYTTQPTVTVDNYPTAVQPGAPVEVQFTIADGAHSQSAYVRWDTVSHADDNAYANWSDWIQGVIGSNIITFYAPSYGTIYFKVYANVDGQGVLSAQEYTITVSGSTATTLVDPVSGTTNDSTPQLQGVAPPSSTVTLYEGVTALKTTTANALGWFQFDLSAPLSIGAHDLHAAAALGGTEGPVSNVVHLVVDPALLVDPVHILLTTRGEAQHLRDESGYANLGGRIWTRTGDVVEVSIPISCTAVYSSDLYLGGNWATSLMNSGNAVYVGTYTPPGSGTYSVDLKVRCEGASGPIHTINLLTGLIDPDGYVYAARKGEDHRLAGASVTCYELIDEGSNIWQVWNAAIWGQTNPLITGADGYYSFFTLPGKYKVRVTMPGYKEYESPVLTVVDAPIHHNVGLQINTSIFLPLLARK